MNPRPEPTIEKLGDRQKKIRGYGEKVPLKLGGQYLSQEAALPGVPPVLSSGYGFLESRRAGVAGVGRKNVYFLYCNRGRHLDAEMRPGVGKN